MILRPPRSTLFPYTTLSDLGDRAGRALHLALRGAHHVHRRAVRPRLRLVRPVQPAHRHHGGHPEERGDRKSTRLNSSHMSISYAVFCLKKKNIKNTLNSTHN